MDRSLIQSRLQELFGDKRPTVWITRERPKIDRIACPWLIRRFIDPHAKIVYVPTGAVLHTAARTGAVAFDIPGAPLTHAGDKCSFDAFIEQFGLTDEPLLAIAAIVRGADTDRHELAPEAAGLHALSLGMAAIFGDDQELLRNGLLIYDALYAWASRARGERHSWTPEAIEVAARS
jgi:hypothetical protein